MKTIKQIIVLIALAITVFSSACFASDGQYIEAMKKNIQLVYEGKSVADLQSAVNGFKRIATVEKTKWEPHYYAAFGYIMIATRDSVAERKDQALDLALESIKNAVAIVPNESEVVALQGFVYMIRISIDPASRGSRFTGLAMQYFQTALRLNGDNPRALALLAHMQFGTANFFGSPTDEACQTNNAALAKFDTFKSENPLAPQWGRGMSEKLKAGCK